MPLLPEVQDQIKSSVIILALNDVVLELVKNALDAQAMNIWIEVDFRRGSCAVEDDGLGIPEGDFKEGGRLGLMHRICNLVLAEQQPSDPKI